MRMLIMGPPGAGKGTLSEVLCEKYQLEHVSTGDMFRRNIKEQTELGVIAAGYINDGNLVPDEVTNAMVEHMLKTAYKDKSFLLDGFPRKLSQAKELDRILADMKISIDALLNIVVPDDDIVRRLSGRRVCPNCGASYHIENKRALDAEHCDKCHTEIIQRPDDAVAVIKSRLTIYHTETEPVLDYYRSKGKVLDLDNTGSIDELIANSISVIADELADVIAAKAN